MQKKAVVLLSGGLDSSTCLAIAKSQGFICYALSFSYGQKHSVELEAAKNIAQLFQSQAHKIIHLALETLLESALLTPEKAVPDFQAMAGIPTTYVPARNTIFLSIALGWAEVLAADDIFIGANAVDYSGYPDCRPEYIKAYEVMANLATKRGVEGKKLTIHTPLLHLTKSEIIQEGVKLGMDYSQTISCYRANAAGRACGTCDSCIYRTKGFNDAKIADPTLYMNENI